MLFKYVLDQVLVRGERRLTIASVKRRLVVWLAGEVSRCDRDGCELSVLRDTLVCWPIRELLSECFDFAKATHLRVVEIINLPVH